MFAQAREIAGVGSTTFDGATVADVLDQATSEYGEAFSVILAGSKVWLNGSPATGTDPVGDNDEVAVLPPVSGG